MDGEVEICPRPISSKHAKSTDSGLGVNKIKSLGDIVVFVDISEYNYGQIK